jgi:hypothetical protein
LKPTFGLTFSHWQRNCFKNKLDPKLMAVLVTFSLLWQNTWEKQLTEKKVYFDSSFRDFSPWSLFSGLC